MWLGNKIMHLVSIPRVYLSSVTLKTLTKLHFAVIF